MSAVFRSEVWVTLVVVGCLLLAGGAPARLAWAHHDPSMAGAPSTAQYDAGDVHAQGPAVGDRGSGVEPPHTPDPIVEEDDDVSAGATDSTASATASPTASATPSASASAASASAGASTSPPQPKAPAPYSAGPAEDRGSLTDGHPEGEVEETRPTDDGSEDEESDGPIPGYPYEGKPCAEKDCGLEGIERGYECAVFHTKRGERVIGCYTKLDDVGPTYKVRWYHHGEQYDLDIIHRQDYLPPPSPPNWCKSTCGVKDVPQGWECYRGSQPSHGDRKPLVFCKRPGYVFGEPYTEPGKICAIVYDAKGRPWHTEYCHGGSGGATGLQAGRDSQEADEGLEDGAGGRFAATSGTSRAGPGFDFVGHLRTAMEFLLPNTHWGDGPATVDGRGGAVSGGAVSGGAVSGGTVSGGRAPGSFQDLPALSGGRGKVVHASFGRGGSASGGTAVGADAVVLDVEESGGDPRGAEVPLGMMQSATTDGNGRAVASDKFFVGYGSPSGSPSGGVLDENAGADRANGAVKPGQRASGSVDRTGLGSLVWALGSVAMVGAVLVAGRARLVRFSRR